MAYNIEDIQKKETQAYLIASSILYIVRDLPIKISEINGFEQLSPDKKESIIDSFQTIASNLQQLIVLINSILKDLRKNSEMTKSAKSFLRETVVHLQKVQLSISDDRIRTMFQHDLTILENELGIPQPDEGKGPAKR